MQITHDDVHGQLDGPYFLDYALFTGILRHYVSRSLQILFRQDPNDLHRRLYALGLYKEEYAAYEDAGAMLEAFLRWRRGEIKKPVVGMLRYSPEKVFLADLLRRRKISSPSDLYDELGIEEWIPKTWPTNFPTIDAAKVLRKVCEFLFVDCQKNQNRNGIEAYNRIKHGLMLIPNAQGYMSTMPQIPAVVIRNLQGTPNMPYALLGLPIDDAALDERERAISFVQSSLRSLAAFYVTRYYPGLLMIDKKIAPAELVFNAPDMRTCKEFMQQVSDKH